MNNKEEKKSFKHTLNLPQTDFSIRANAKEKEPELLARWQKDDLYNVACAKNKKEGTPFILHDGPPFANGHMHMGHALNRTLKDVVCKAKRMSGHHVISFPGWDCHGLPIELKVAKELGVEKKSTSVERVAFKKKCREYAQKWIDIQREEIIRLGVISDWDHPYITMSPGYEASIIKAFATFVEKGYIERKGKTVPWCASCQTVLATAEIEHKDKKDPSCYILFPFSRSHPFDTPYDAKASKGTPAFAETTAGRQGERDLGIDLSDREISLLVWTTTPWTIPLNRAVVLHPTAEYVVLQGKEPEQAFIVGEKLADTICQEIGIEKKVLAKFRSEKLHGFKVNHPYIKDLQVPVILDDMVLLDDGTACVHSAPGCGPEDYMLGVKNGLEIFSPLSPDGKYTEGIQPTELEGMSVVDGQIWSIKKMHEVGKLFHKSSIRHSYPHCWRCQTPLIFRATDQWFCDLKKDDLVERAIQETGKLKFVPDWGKTRLTSSMASRTEWCLSRQRQWGVPITALICNKCEHPYLDADLIRNVAEHVKKRGIEYWDEVTIEELHKDGLLQKDFSCIGCGNKELSAFRKEMDIVDVWFESGVSHTAVQDQYPVLTIPADLYLEGSDQHRGWFQSSTLSAMIMYNKPCTKSFVTHSYVLDAQAEKMSKSKGNVISPQEIFKTYSADILRLWLAGSDFENDISVTEKSLKNAAEVYRKIRNTCRFMISNLYDFDIKKDGILLTEMTPLDQYAIAKSEEIIESAHKAYSDYWFTNVFHTVNRYCTNDLSSFYLDIIKDRLYIEKADGYLRRSAQTAMYHILDTLTRLMAPILSFLAEEVSDCYQADKKESIHLQNFPQSLDVWEQLKQSSLPGYQIASQEGLMRDTARTASLAVQMTGWWNLLESIRPELLKAIEGQRETGVVKHSLEAKVAIYIDENNESGKMLQEFMKYLKTTLFALPCPSQPLGVVGSASLGGVSKGTVNVERFFKDFIIVSQIEFAQSNDDLQSTALPWLFVSVAHADGTKCPRCWQWEETDHADGLCKRCAEIV